MVAEGLKTAADEVAGQVVGEHTALARLVSAAESDLARDTARLVQLRHELQEANRRYEQRHARTAFRVLHSSDAVREHLTDLADNAVSECLSVNPGRMHRPEAMSASKPLNQLALERGVAIRSIYQEASILDADTLAYGQWLESLGGEVRTIPQVTQRLVLVDRHTAILGIGKDHREDGLALEITTPALVHVLLHYFEGLWSDARPYAARPQRSAVGIDDPLAKRLLELLAEGATDEQAARHLGLSERTVRRLMSTLMKELGATSRLQAGVAAVRRGWI